jgi:hypothetical protein
MIRNSTYSVRETYNRLANVYAGQYAAELQSKPLDRELLSRFVADMQGRCDVCAAVRATSPDSCRVPGRAFWAGSLASND